MLLPYANKTRLAGLLRSRGFNVPDVRKARFDSLNASRAYWLRWTDTEGCREAYFSAAAGRPVLAVDGVSVAVTLDELRRFGLVQEK